MRRAKFHCFNPAKNADKVYDLVVMPAPVEGLFDVVAQYGRRGAKRLSFFVHAQAVTAAEADRAFESAKRTRLNHGYKQVEAF
jgi:hypothetical protein